MKKKNSLFEAEFKSILGFLHASLCFIQSEAILGLPKSFEACLGLFKAYFRHFYELKKKNSNPGYQLFIEKNSIFGNIRDPWLTDDDANDNTIPPSALFTVG